MRLKLALLGATLFAGALLIGASAPAAYAVDTLTNATLKEQVPVFELDKSWPQLPNNWVLGLVASIRTDSHGNVWLIHRPRTVTSGTPAPSVIEFDPSGKYKASWGGPDWCKTTPGCDWPDTEHNILVDDKDNVYLSGSSPSGQSKTTRSDDMIIKFTNTGKFIKQFGGRDVSKGSTDHDSVNKPGDFTIWHGEMYISDGYGNRRVLVLDPETFAFKREWAAFGKPPTDIPGESGGPGSSGGARPTAQQAGVEVPAGGGGAAAGGRRGGGGGGGGAAAGGGGGGRGRAALDTEGPGSDHFASPVHGIIVSNDGIVYVVDRSNRRVQLFKPDGTYLNQVFLNRAGPAAGSVTGVALSPDPEQKWLYMSDYGNSHIAIVDRKTLQIMYQFGQRGAEPGNFQGVHLITTNAHGDIYAAEVAPGARAQRFIYKGMSSTLPANALTPEQLAPDAPAARGGR